MQHLQREQWHGLVRSYWEGVKIRFNYRIRFFFCDQHILNYGLPFFFFFLPPPLLSLKPACELQFSLLRVVKIQFNHSASLASASVPCSATAVRRERLEGNTKSSYNLWGCDCGQGRGDLNLPPLSAFLNTRWCLT